MKTKAKQSANVSFKKKRKSAKVRPSQHSLSLQELMRLAKQASMRQGRA